jgi:hypothetical protein
MAYLDGHDSLVPGVVSERIRSGEHFLSAPGRDAGEWELSVLLPGGQSLQDRRHGRSIHSAANTQPRPGRKLDLN